MMSPRFAGLLASGRAEFNRRVADTRRRYPAFDTAAFSALLLETGDQVVGAAAVCAAGPPVSGPAAPPAAGGAPSVNAERLPAVAMALFDAALALVAQGQGGGIAARAWRELAPAYAGLLCAQPAQVLGMLANAALHLDQSGHVRPEEWLTLMAGLAPRVADVQQLAVVGQICVWRAGMAHFRHGAIAAADGLPEALALAAFGMPVPASADASGAGAADGNAAASAALPTPVPQESGAAAMPSAWAALRGALLRDPWWSVGDGARRRLADGTDVGGFTGLGGAFPEPPDVRAAAGGFLVRSGDRYFLLMADACGVVLHAATREEFEQPPWPAAPATAPATLAAVTRSSQGLAINGRAVATDLPADGLRVACNAHTAAITSPYSHAIRVLPLP